MLPRYVSESRGAEALGLPLATFRHWVTIGRLPAPVADVQLFDLKALHAACDRFAGLSSPRDALDAWLEQKGMGDGLGAVKGRAHR
jgi:hypothetical protein